MKPLGLAMRSFFDGDTGAELTVRRDDGQENRLPVGYFFRDESEFTAIDREAIDCCRGSVLDVGAGTGIHSLVLRKRGLSVVPIDISPHAVKIMRRRGLKTAQCADIFKFQGGPFDTVLMMGHGIGVVETISGLERFLGYIGRVMSRGGQILLDSLDVRMTDDARNLAYHEAARKAGRYVGEIRIQLEFQGKKGPSCGWLHVTPETLTERAEAMGWQSAIAYREKAGDYLARLTR
jgi:SAM-dependent methyltransferase